MVNICSRCGDEIKHCANLHHDKKQTYNGGMYWKDLPDKFYCVKLSEIGENEHVCSKACLPRPNVIRKATRKWI